MKVGKQRRADYYRHGIEDTVRELHSHADKGLSPAEASARLHELGGNVLAAGRQESWAQAYARQFKDLMVLLLIACALLSLVTSDDLRTGIVLIVLVLFNTTIGFLQEFKAERTMASLEKLVVAHAQVIRGGKLVQIPSAELVLGDLVYIEEGDSVPADVRIIREEALSSNDFALTGESNPSRKFSHAISADVPVADRHNLVFMGTTIATGHGYGLVVATGMHTELGRIAGLSQATPAEASPLQKELRNIATRVTQGTVVLCAILLPIATHSGLSWREAFLFAIGIASSIIPQGLPAEINTSLAGAASLLARAKALVKKLSAVETLGATDVICTDKTGTLTKNQMTVEQAYIGHRTYCFSGSGYEPAGDVTDEHGKPLSQAAKQELSIFFAAGAMASNARINPPDDEHPAWYCLGDPTEGAVISMAGKAGIDAGALDVRYPELREFPFDSARKRMSSLRHYGDGKQIYVFIKGAPESVLERCHDFWDHGHTRRLSQKDHRTILAHSEQLAHMAMRNLGFAYKVLPAETNVAKLTMEEVENGLTWLGLASMIDPIREAVPAAMAAARRAHIRISIVTGDNAITATAIALRAKLADHPKDITVVAGDELADLSDRQVRALACRGGTIFSRVAPEDKLRIVGLVRSAGHVVAVTGDGINDAPALKRADIGVAMGKTGTDVAKQAAEIILLDDSFHTLVGAIKQGRIIFQNIKKGTLSCFTSNFAELVVNLASLAAVSTLHIPLALSVMQILAVDLIAELFPIAALGRDKADGDLMDAAPRDPKAHILNRRSIIDLAFCGLLIGGFAFANYLWFYHRHGINPAGLSPDTLLAMQATSLTYVTIVLCQLANILQRRSSAGLFTRYQLHNRLLWGAIGLSLFCVMNIVYNPWIAPYFRAGSLSWQDWLFALAAAGLFVLIREFQRYTQRHHRANVIALHRHYRARAS